MKLDSTLTQPIFNGVGHIKDYCVGYCPLSEDQFAWSYGPPNNSYDIEDTRNDVRVL